MNPPWLNEAALQSVCGLELEAARRVIGITRRTDALASPGAKLLMEEIARRCPAVLADETA